MCWLVVTQFIACRGCVENKRGFVERRTGNKWFPYYKRGYFKTGFYLREFWLVVTQFIACRGCVEKEQR